MQQLEYDSYYKFLVSMGVILIITPVITLGLYLSGHFDLTMSQAEFEELYSEASKSICLRYYILNALYYVFPAISTLSIIAGAHLLCTGCKHWRKIQRIQDNKLNLEVKDLDNRVHKMSSEEKIEKQMNELMESHRNSDNSTALNLDPSTIERGKQFAQEVFKGLDIENRCAELIRIEKGNDYTVVQNVSLDHYYYDIIAWSNKSRKDEIYEIKNWDVVKTNILRHTISRLITSTKAYSDVNHRDALAQLWIVTNNESVDTFYKAIKEMTFSVDIPVKVRVTDLDNNTYIRFLHS